ncbi:hypothetical protein WG66_016705 [Moniliophthora roreri]|nr:hypothetical protein WG66_016705 [Moniliophthora roreri]
MLYYLPPKSRHGLPAPTLPWSLHRDDAFISLGAVTSQYDFDDARNRARSSFNRAALIIGLVVGIGALLSVGALIWAFRRLKKQKEWQRNYVREAQARAAAQQPPQYTPADPAGNPGNPYVPGIYIPTNIYLDSADNRIMSFLLEPSCSDSLHILEDHK